MNPTVSIVVNTFNRADVLANTLRGLQALRYPSYEIVVVNGPSTDETASVLDCWKGSIKIADCPSRNLSESRNVGIANSAGDLIAFIDDDAVPHPDWLSRILPHYADQKVAGVGGFTMDNTGVAYQVCKTICDRFGNAFNVPEFFDERRLNFPNTPYYPSLLGTNSSFRASALHEIGGFDNTFAYLLDETDVCLRLVDRGYKIIYEPDAVVFHQFAASHIRNERRIARTLYPSAVSKSYFIHRHGSAAFPNKAQAELDSYREEILSANTWLANNKEISWEHAYSLDQDLLWGIRDGAKTAAVRHDKIQGDLNVHEPARFVPMPKREILRIAMISRGFPPDNEAGIARWTSLMARGLADLGHEVHIICEARSEPSVDYNHGVWVHRITADVAGAQAELEDGLPQGMGRWSMAVERELRALSSFKLDVVSSPIWDLEGVRTLRMAQTSVVLSLHTPYALAKPHKPEWSARPIFERLVVDRMIRAEAEALKRAPTILANSEAIIRDIESVYAVAIKEKALLVPHGTTDPLHGRRSPIGSGDRLSVLYVGRFEQRKGFDIAVDAVAKMLRDMNIDADIRFVGGEIDDNSRSIIEGQGAEFLLSESRVEWAGKVDREKLDDLYAASHIVLMPSRYESFGLVAIEAMAARACVIGLAVGGLAEVLTDGRTGYAVAEEGAANEIAARLRILSQNRELLESMRRAARADFEKRFTVEEMAKRAEHVYRQATNRMMVA